MLLLKEAKQNYPQVSKNVALSPNITSLERSKRLELREEEKQVRIEIL